MKHYFRKYKPLVIFISSIIVVLLLIVSKPSVKPEDSQYIAPLVEIKKVSLEDIQVRIFSQGTVRPGKEIILSSEIAGKINGLSKKKEVIVRFIFMLILN